MLELYSWDIDSYVDTMEDQTVKVLGAWPFRAWIFEGEIVRMIGSPDHANFYVTDLQTALTNLLSEKDNTEESPKNEFVVKSN
mmetsp:Transcript_55819/g.63718  ORF Transcript_55819/g.63718 Transcript_55819/m.63718 type:complete len:83 (-) Transcript_55819:335-583(-)